MPPSHPFPHLPLLLRYEGRAVLPRGGKAAAETKANRANFATHAGTLQAAAGSVSRSWKARQATRQHEHLPNLSKGIPLLLQVDPGFDLDILREKFGFEIVSEQEDGYVIVASEDFDLTALLDMIRAFGTNTYGSATVASIHRLFDDPNQEDRLKRILSDALFQAWPTLQDAQTYICDIGVECLGPQEIPDLPKKGKRDNDASWAHKEAVWSQQRADAYQAWDDTKSGREGEIEAIVAFYQGRIINIIDNQAVDSVRLPDSFTIRLELPGKGLRDIVLNYPYIFEVIEPEEIELPQRAKVLASPLPPAMTPLPPPASAPAVCVIDSGIQEAHIFLEPAIDKPASFCFLPGRPANEVADYVRPGGHGTRVAGAVLYGETVLRSGNVPLEFWIQNARILDADCRLPVDLFPPAAIRAVIERYHLGPRNTRIFNHSINIAAPCRLRLMSAWAAEMDALCETYDILIVQSSGNLYCSAPLPICGVKEHLQAGRDYPGYLNEAACRVANPAQSLQALTVGSVAYAAFEGEGWRTFAPNAAYPSAFTRTGFGIWNVIKPEVVEFAGDNLRTPGNSPDVGTPSHARQAYPELVRSTVYPPGPAADRDEVGTSFAAPKVAQIAAKLQQVLPDETSLLYRALIVQSARWPAWTQQANGTELVAILRWIGYGVPNLERATSNTPHRTTLIASRDKAGEDELRIKAREGHIFQIPIPESMRRQADEYDILIEVTLSYAAQPRRTRRNLRRYLSTWVDWKSSKLGESIDSFRLRALKDEDEADESQAKGSPIPWMIDASARTGMIRGVKRNAGTVQKDWAVVKSNTLPYSFCIAVVGHPGWSNDPDSSAKYALTVSFEILGREIAIYDDLRLAVQSLQAEIEAEVEAEAELETPGE